MYRAVLLDDEAFVLEGLESAIDWSGFNFEIAGAFTNPVQALDFLRSHPADLLITDISMPQMSGLDVIRQAKAIDKDLFVLVLSAFDNFEYVRTAMRCGAENYLLKPLDADELSESLLPIAEHLRQRTPLAETYGSSMLSFRSLFTESWVKDKLTPDEFLARAQMLGINLQLDNYTVVFFCAPGAEGQVMSQLFDELLARLVGSFQSHFYFENSACLVCILSSAHTGIEQFLDSLDTLHQRFRFFACAGVTVGNYAAVGESYRSAYRYLFLQHSALNSFVSCFPPLSAGTEKLISQDLEGLDPDSYLRQLRSVLTPALDVRQRMALELAVVSHGVSQTGSVLAPDPLLLPLLARLRLDTRNYNELTAFLSQFVSACCQLLEERKKARAGQYPYMDTVLRAIQDLSNKDISLKTLAARLDMNPSYLGAVFYQQTGRYFNDYLSEERLKHAAALMVNPQYKLKDIVEQCGFSSQAYFNRLFKRKYGASPLAWRRELRDSAS